MIPAVGTGERCILLQRTATTLSTDRLTIGFTSHPLPHDGH